MVPCNVAAAIILIINNVKTIQIFAQQNLQSIITNFIQHIANALKTDWWSTNAMKKKPLWRNFIKFLIREAKQDNFIFVAAPAMKEGTIDIWRKIVKWKMYAFWMKNKIDIILKISTNMRKKWAIKKKINYKSLMEKSKAT